MRIRYIGDPNDDFGGPDFVTYYGVRLPKGVYVELLDPDGIVRLGRHSHFEVEAKPGDPETMQPLKRGPGRPRKVHP